MTALLLDAHLKILGKLKYPVVVKPRRIVSWNGNVGTYRTAGFAFSAKDVRNRCAAVLARTGEFPLIQEWIQGEEAGVEFLCEDGRVLAACAHRRIRSESPSGGPGAVKETVSLCYRGLGERAERLVAKLRWSGPKEINGRFWGSLPLAIAAGVDFPYLYYRLACGQRVVQHLQYP